MDLNTVRFDPENATREEWRRYHAYRRVRDREVEPDDPIAEDRTVEAWMSRPHPQWQELHFAVLDPADVERQVGDVAFEVSRPGAPSHAGNKHIAWVGIHLLRAYRRRGFGTRILPLLVDLAVEHGRTVVQSWVQEDDGRAFADAIGAKVVQRRRQNRLAMDQVDWAMVDAWIREGEARNPGTSFRWFVNRIDDDILDAYGRAFTEVFNMQPFGKTDHGEFVFNPESFRDREARNEAVGGTWTTVVSVEPDGEISSLTETTFHPDEPGFLWQGLTGVRNAYRGRGLGKWVKAAMLREIRGRVPEIRTVVTGNASSNAAMLSINDRLGFRVHKEPVVVEIPRDALAERLRLP